MKKALFIATVGGFLASFEKSDMTILQELGYEVHCATNLTITNDEEKIQNMLNLGVIAHQIDFFRSPLSIQNIKAYKQLLKLVKDEAFELVHCHTPMGGVLGRIVAHQCKVPHVIYTAHGFHFWEGAPKLNWCLFYPIEKFLSKWTNVLITINSYDYKIATQRFKAQNTYRIHGVGVDFEKFNNIDTDKNIKRKQLGIKNSDIFVLSVGELSPDKNQIMVIEALNKIKNLSTKRFVYMIAGKGSQKKVIEDKITELGLSNQVKLLGYRTDIAELLQACDIYVFPSIMEGLSVALMEAIAAEKPIACSRIRGNVDLVMSEESFFDFSSPDDIARVLLDLSDGNNYDMIIKNKKNLESYKLSNVQKSMIDIYRKTIDK